MRDSIRFGPGAPGIERAEVFLSTHRYEPHRHATYAIGITTSGVQVFHYRGVRRVCLPGQLHILHPDEAHDGGAGTDEGFGYRILYIATDLVRDALGSGTLPLVADPVQPIIASAKPIARFLWDDERISDLGAIDLAIAVADTLIALGGRPPMRRGSIDVRAVASVREYLAAHATEPIPASQLEIIGGADRFTIARHFRWAFGLSPDRYRMERRLAMARKAIEQGRPLAQAAAESGYADQSHLTRQFKQAYGMTPGRWTTLRQEALRPRSGNDRPGRPRLPRR